MKWLKSFFKELKIIHQECAKAQERQTQYQLLLMNNQFKYQNEATRLQLEYQNNLYKKPS